MSEPRIFETCPACQGDRYTLDTTLAAFEKPEAEECGRCKANGEVLTPFGHSVARLVVLMDLGAIRPDTVDGWVKPGPEVRQLVGKYRELADRA